MITISITITTARMITEMIMVLKWWYSNDGDDDGKDNKTNNNDNFIQLSLS